MIKTKMYMIIYDSLSFVHDFIRFVFSYMIIYIYIYIYK